MPVFAYKARDKMGTVVAGDMDAPSIHMVEQELSRKGHFPISIQASNSKTRKKKEPVDLLESFKKIKPHELVMFTRQMSTLFNAGIPLVSILRVLQEQMINPKFKHVLEKIAKDVEDGLSLSEAMARHPNVFSELYVSMIQAGETGGVMADLLKRLADLLETQLEHEVKIKGAFRYSKLVLGAMFIAISILMWRVVPIFVKMFAGAKIELPLATKILISAHAAFNSYWHITLGLILVLFFGFRKYISTRIGRLQWDRFKLQTPILGPIVLKSTMAKFTRVFGTLQMSGVPILEILDVCSRVVDNRVITGVVQDLRGSVEDGLGIAPPLKRSGIVPPLVIQMIGAGEESGALDEMLMKVADFYDEEVDRSIKNLASLIEPILLVFLGSLVLFLALAIFMPMWDMAKMARR